MICAKDANARAIDQLQIIVAFELKNIEEQINEAVNNGKFSICNEGSMTLHCKSQLEKFGYKVDIGVQYNQPYYRISW